MEVKMTTDREECMQKLNEVFEKYGYTEEEIESAVVFVEKLCGNLKVFVENVANAIEKLFCLIELNKSMDTLRVLASMKDFSNVYETIEACEILLLRKSLKEKLTEKAQKHMAMKTYIAYSTKPAASFRKRSSACNIRNHTLKKKTIFS